MKENPILFFYLRGGWKRCWECWNLWWSFEYFGPKYLPAKAPNSCILEIFARCVGALCSLRGGKYYPRLFYWKYIFYLSVFCCLRKCNKNVNLVISFSICFFFWQKFIFVKEKLTFLPFHDSVRSPATWKPRT